MKNKTNNLDPCLNLWQVGSINLGALEVLQNPLNLMFKLMFLLQNLHSGEWCIVVSVNAHMY